MGDWDEQIQSFVGMDEDAREVVWAAAVANETVKVAMSAPFPGFYMTAAKTQDEAARLTDAAVDNFEAPVLDTSSMKLGFPLLACVGGILVGAVATMLVMRRSITAPTQLLG